MQPGASRIKSKNLGQRGRETKSPPSLSPVRDQHEQERSFSQNAGQAGTSVGIAEKNIPAYWKKKQELAADSPFLLTMPERRTRSQMHRRVAVVLQLDLPSDNRRKPRGCGSGLLGRHPVHREYSQPPPASLQGTVGTRQLPRDRYTEKRQRQSIGIEFGQEGEKPKWEQKRNWRWSCACRCVSVSSRLGVFTSVKVKTFQRRSVIADFPGKLDELLIACIRQVQPTFLSGNSSRSLEMSQEELLTAGALLWKPHTASRPASSSLLKSSKW